MTTQYTLASTTNTTLNTTSNIRYLFLNSDGTIYKSDIDIYNDYRIQSWCYKQLIMKSDYVILIPNVNYMYKKTYWVHKMKTLGFNINVACNRGPIIIVSKDKKSPLSESIVEEFEKEATYIVNSPRIIGKKWYDNNYINK